MLSNRINSVICWLALIPLECALAQETSESTVEAEFATKITDCFFTKENRTDAVELVCGNETSKDDCFSLLFQGEQQQRFINRLKVLYLSIGACRNQQLDESLSPIFPNLISLDISNLKYKLEDTQFGGKALNFRQLRTLNASNSLTTVNKKLFTYINPLTEVDVSSTRDLQTVSSATFEGIYTLTKINLSASQISYLQSTTFSHLVGLEVIDLSANRLRVFDMHTFDQNPAIKEIHIQNNWITHLMYNRDSYPSFKSLVYFDISSNSMKLFFGDIIKHLGAHLEVLNWSGSCLLEVNNARFLGLRGLREVRLQKTDLTDVDFGAFKCPHKLEFLDLSRNKINHIDFRSDHGNFDNFKTLLLSYNYLKKLDGASIELFPQLQEVDISYNFLAENSVRQFVEQWTNLTVISENKQKPLLTYGPELDTKITDCMFIDNRTTPPFTVELICENATKSNDNCYSMLFQNESADVNRWDVKHLRTGQCHSTDFDSSLSYLFRNTETLDVSHLGLEWEYPDGGQTINFVFLRKFVASNNNLSKFTASMFYEPHVLKEIDLSHNKFAKVVLNYFMDAVQVQTVNLSHNQITYFETAAIRSLVHLKILDLSHNLLRTFDLNMFQFNLKMREIYVQDNLINSFIHDVELFKGFLMLAVFNASGNRISVWSDGIIQSLGVSTLHTLDLSQNFLNRINASTRTLFEGFHSLEEVNLRGTGLELFSFDGFENPAALKSLDLSDNQLVTINFTSENGNYSNLETLLLSGNLLHRLDGASVTLFPNLSVFSLSKNQLSCQYAKDLIAQWDGLTVIGHPCDQRSSVTEHRESGVSTNIFKLIAIIGLVFLAVTFVILLVIRRRKLLANVKRTEKSFEAKIDVDQRKEHIYEEPIYYEITEPYDHLSFAAMKISTIKSHYHNANSLKSKSNVETTFQ